MCRLCYTRHNQFPNVNISHKCETANRCSFQWCLAILGCPFSNERPEEGGRGSTMQYIFLVVAAAWALQFLLSYWQLQRFYRQLANLRKLGRCAVGMHGNRWRGRTYGILVVDANDCISHAAAFSGWTIFSKPQPVAGLTGMRRDA